MITGILPFRADTVGKLKKCIIDGGYAIPNYVSDVCSSVIKGLLKPTPTDRMSIQDLIDCTWLRGEEFIDAMEPLNLSPIGGHEDGEVKGECIGSNGSCRQSKNELMENVESRVRLTDDEMEARKVCLELGISEDLLGVARNKASRSGITGTYHIVLHRIQKRRSDLDNPVPDRRSNAGMTNGGSRYGKENVGGNGDAAKEKKHSKLCVIF